MQSETKLTYSSNEGLSTFWDFIMGIMKLVEANGEDVVVKIDGKKVTITPEMVFIGTDEVVRVLNQYRKTR